MKKLIYTEPEIEIIYLASEDICVASGLEGNRTKNWDDLWTGEDELEF